MPRLERGRHAGGAESGSEAAGEVEPRAVWLAGGYNMAFLTLPGAIFIAFASVFVRRFTDDAAVAAIAVTCLRRVSLAYPVYAWGIIMQQAFNGAGDTVTPTWINLGCYWMLRIPRAGWLAEKAAWGPKGVYVAISSAETVPAIVPVILFRRGRWKSVRMGSPRETMPHNDPA